jgi:hypothetical protein
MTELDQIWSRMFSEARKNAEAAGRGGVADYLRLRTTNDAIRSAAVAWMIDTMIEIASPAIGKPQGVVGEREDAHRFTVGIASMAGSRLAIRRGVRCLNVEAGWARTPADGIMRGGSMAVARLSHFGMPQHNSVFRLMRGTEFPSWVNEDDAAIDSGELIRHFEILMD